MGEGWPVSIFTAGCISAFDSQFSKEGKRYEKGVDRKGGSGENKKVRGDKKKEKDILRKKYGNK